MHEKKLYYYEKDAKIEIDFFIRYQKMATAIEVKSAEKATSKAMTAIIQNYGVKHGIKLSAKNVAGNDTDGRYYLCYSGIGQKTEVYVCVCT